MEFTIILMTDWAAPGKANVPYHCWKWLVLKSQGLFACFESYLIALVISWASLCMTSTIKVRWWLCMCVSVPFSACILCIEAWIRLDRHFDEVVSEMVLNFVRAKSSLATCFLRFMELVAFALKHKYLFSFEFCHRNSSGLHASDWSLLWFPLNC